MSHSTYYLFGLNGKPIDELECASGHGAGPVIWDTLCMKYFGREIAWMNIGGNKFPELLARAEAGRLPFEEALCLFITVPTAYLPREDFERAAQAIEKVVGAYHPERINHWPKVAAWLRANKGRADVLGFGVYNTSVSDDPWLRFNKETSQYEAVDVRKMPRIVVPQC